VDNIYVHNQFSPFFSNFVSNLCEQGMSFSYPFWLRYLTSPGRYRVAAPPSMTFFMSSQPHPLWWSSEGICCTHHEFTCIHTTWMSGGISTIGMMERGRSQRTMGKIHS
jgi:hypothetical protein